MLRRKRKRKYIVAVLLFLFLGINAPVCVQAAPLIQTTTLQSDFEALTYLELMQTPVLKQPNLQQAYENVWQTTVKIQGEHYFASGSIWKITQDQIVIVTNKHVLEYYDENSVILFFNGRVEKGEKLGAAAQIDAGFLTVDTSLFSYEELLQMRSVRPVVLAWEQVEAGTEFFLIDMVSDVYAPKCYEGTVLEKLGHIEEWNEDMMLGAAYGRPGMSGSGVFDDYGNYIGMLTGGTGENQIASLPVNKVIEAYGEVQIE